MLTSRSVSDLLNAFSAPDPTPGGGSAAALAGALGASLFAMVAGLPKTRTGTTGERAALDDARTRLLALRDTLVDLIDRDAAAYDEVVAAYRLPKATDAEKAARKAAIQSALRHAAEIPLETMRTAAAAQAAAGDIAEHGNPSARTDMAVGMQLLMVAGSGAWLNVDANLTGLTDPGVAAEITASMRAAMEDAGRAMHRLMLAPAIAELHKDAGERAGHRHGPPPGVPPERFAGPAIAMLRRLGSPEARQALQALATSGNPAIAALANEALLDPVQHPAPPDAAQE